MMNKPLRIQRKRIKGWRMPAGAIYAGRPSKWNNAWRVEKVWWSTRKFPWAVRAGNRLWECATKMEAHALSAEMFRDWLLGDHACVAAAQIKLDILQLRGKDLACWCQLCPAHQDGKPFDVTCPDCAPCHVDVLGDLANR